MEQVSGWSEQGGSAVVISGTQGSGSQRFQQSFRSATVTVRDSSNNLATIYSDDLATPTAKANPFTASSTTGAWNFYTTTGTYTITFSGGSITAPFSITVNVGLGNSGGVPSYAFASLPTSKTQNAGDIARVTNTIGGLWMDSGTQWSKVGVVINAMDAPFNVVADGTNQLTGIAAAITACAAYGGGTVMLPPGNIGISGSIVPVAKVRLSGSLVTATVLKPTANNVTVIEHSGESWVTDLTIDGTGRTGIIGIDMNSNCRVSRVRITTCAVGLDYVGINASAIGVFYTQVDDIYIDTCTTAGIRMQTTPSSNFWVNSNQLFNLQIRTCAIAVLINGASGNSFYALDCETNTQGVRILSGQGNRIYGNWFERNPTSGTLYQLHIARSSTTAGTVIHANGLLSFCSTIDTTGAITSGTPTLTVASATNFEAGKVVLVTGAGAAGADLYSEVIAVSGTTITLADNAGTTVGPAVVVRGPQFINTAAYQIMTEQYLYNFGTAFHNILSVINQGGTGRVLKQTTLNGEVTVTTLAASELSNGVTGSGAVVLANTPTLITPVIGAATGTSLALGAALTGTIASFKQSAPAATLAIYFNNTSTAASDNGINLVLIADGENNTGDAWFRFITKNGGASEANWSLGYDVSSGRFSITPSGTLGNPAFATDSSGRGSLGTEVGAGGGGASLSITQGAQASSITANTAGISVQDVAGTAELFGFDEAGNDTQLTPHPADFMDKLSADHELPWAYSSSNRYLGKKVQVDMAGLVRAIEKLTGEQFMFVTDTDAKADWDVDQEEQRLKREAAIQAAIIDRETLETMIPSLASAIESLSDEAKKASLIARHQECCERLERLVIPSPLVKKPLPKWLALRGVKSSIV